MEWKSQNVRKFREAFEGALGDEAILRSLAPLEIRDLDVYTTQKEAEEAIKGSLNVPAEDLQVVVSKENIRKQI